MFYLIPPSEENLIKYEHWVMSVHQSEIFFGGQVSSCYKCRVLPGNTLFIPTGKHSDIVLYVIMLQWAEPQMHILVSSCLSVYLSVCVSLCNSDFSKLMTNKALIRAIYAHYDNMSKLIVSDF